MTQSPSGYPEVESLKPTPIPLEIPVDGSSISVTLQAGDIVTYWDDYEYEFVSFTYHGTNREGLYVISVSREQGLIGLVLIQITRLAGHMARIQSAKGELKYVKPGEENSLVTEPETHVSIMEYTNTRGLPVFRSVDIKQHGAPKKEAIDIKLDLRAVRIMPDELIHLKTGDTLQYMYIFPPRYSGLQEIVQMGIHLATGQRYIMGITKTDLGLLLSTFEIKEG